MYFTMHVSVHSIFHLVTITFLIAYPICTLYFEQMFKLAIYQYSMQYKLSLMFS